MTFLSSEVRSSRLITLLFATCAVIVFGILVANKFFEPKWEKLRPGMTIAETIAVMGEPSGSLSYDDRNMTELWYPEGKMTTRLIFVGERLENASIGGHKGTPQHFR